MAVRSSAWQVKQLTLSRSKASADETPLYAGGQGVRVLPHTRPVTVGWWTMCTPWHKLVSTIQSVLFKGKGDRRKMPTANYGNRGKKSYKKSSTVCGPVVHFSLTCSLIFFFHYNICSFLHRSLQLCKSPPLLIQKKLSSKRGPCASSPPALLTAPTLEQVHLHKHPNAEQGCLLL